jgi:RNA polymerase sigma-70 factor (ECF subfamily)
MSSGHSASPPGNPATHDVVLLARLRAGSEDDARAALEMVFRAQYASLVRFADSYVRSTAIAEDLVAHVFAWIWNRRTELKVTHGLASYLHAAVRHRAQDYLRRNRVERDWQTTFTDRGESPAIGEGTVTESNPADLRVEHEERLRLLTAAIAELPEKTRVTLWLRWRSGMTAAEIAESTGRTPAAIAMELSRTVSLLRRLLGPLLGCLILTRVG